MRRLLVVSGLLLFLTALAIGAADEPAWLVYQRGLERMRAGEYGEALEYFEKIRASGALMPEVELAVGDVYRLEGEVTLAERHYRRAYELRSQFQVPDDLYAPLYRLEELYWATEDYRQMERTLLDILRQDPVHYQEEFGSNREQLKRIFEQAEGNGLDRVMQLYRFDPVLASPAHSRLAWFYSRTDQPSRAVEHALFSIVSLLTEAMEFYTRSVPSYRFNGVSQFLALAERRSELQEYLSESSLAADLYSLATALYGMGRQAEAAEVWHVLSRSALSGRYRNRADRQLASPKLEPLLTVP